MGGLLDLRVAGPPSLAALTNFWPLTAWGYEIWRMRALSLLSRRPFPLQEEYQLMLDALGNVRGGVYLDLGSSTGLYSRALLLAGAAEVYGLDFSPAMQRQAGRAARGQTGFVPLLASAQAIPLQEGCLDGVAIGGSWNEFADLPRVTAEICRVLRPDGRLWLMFSQASGWTGRVLRATGISFPTLDETCRLLQSHGVSTTAWQEGNVAFVSGRIVKPA